MLSIVVYGRNDNHGYNLHKRVALSINCFAEILNDPDDEIVFVDYNTPDEHPSLIETIQDTLTSKARRTIRIIRAYPSVHRQYADKTPFPVVESIARNIGFRRTNPANRWVLSTNTDMILVPRKPEHSFNDILKNLDDGFYLLPRFELPEALWELVDRSRPDDVISRVRRWGTAFALNEVINRPLVRYDAPGDFQLALRRDLFALSGMDERMLLGNVHVDSNLCRRMEALRGELRSAVDNLFGYHCAHTRTATMVHGRNKISNDFERFVREVTDWRLFDQAESWGQPEGLIEEIALPRHGSMFERALTKVIDPLEEPFDEINWGSGRREALRYSVDHMVPFLASTMAPLPKEYSLGLVPSRPDVVAKVLRLWTELGFKGSVGMRQEDLRRFTESAAFTNLPVAVNITPCTDEDFYAKHDVFLFEFGLATEALNGAAESAPVELDGDNLSAVQDALNRFIVIERQRTLSHPPRRAIFIGVANNRFEPLVNDNFDVTHTPFTSRVRQGFLHVTPQAQQRAGFDPRELADAMRNTNQRRSAPPSDEIVRMWAELHDLIQGSEPSFPVTRGHVDLLNVAQARGLLGLEKFRAEDTVRRINRLRLSNVHGTRALTQLLPEEDPPLANLNKLADPRDWEAQEWWQLVSRFFGGSDSYSSYNRHRDIWLQAQTTYALRGCGLNSVSNVLVVTEHSDDIYAVLSQLAGRVSVCRSAFERPSPLDRIDTERWLDVPVLPRPGRIKFLEQGLSDLPSGSFDFVVFARNSAQAGGSYGFMRALERAQRVLAPGGVVVAALDVDIGGATREHVVTGANLTILLDEIGRKTGLTPVDTPDYRVPRTALDLTVNADREMHKPHFVRERDGGLIAAGLAVLRKREEANADGWSDIKQSRIAWMVGTLSHRLDVSEPFALVDGSVRVEWDDPDVVFAKVARLTLPAGRYTLPLNITPDAHVPDSRTLLGLEIVDEDDRTILLRDITAHDARRGEMSLPFTVAGRAMDDTATIVIRLRNFGRAGFRVEAGNIRPRDGGIDAASHLDLAVRNAIAPNAWRRGEDIVVEREAEHQHFLYGPYQRLESGWWRLQISMSISEAASDHEEVAELKILHGEAGPLPPGILLTPARCAQGPIVVDVFVPTIASAPAGMAGAFEFRLGYRGGGRVELHAFTLDAIQGPGVANTWMFAGHDVVNRETGSAMVWLPRGAWTFEAKTSHTTRVALVSDGQYVAGELGSLSPRLRLDTSSLPGDGWLRLDIEPVLEGLDHLVFQPVNCPFASRYETTDSATESRQFPPDARESVAQTAGEHVPVIAPQRDTLSNTHPIDTAAPVLLIGAASLMGQARIPPRAPRAVDPHFMLAGARSLARANAFVKQHRFDVARIDFADVDYNMQSIPRGRRILALKSWLDLFGSIRRSSRRVVVEIHQIEHRRQGPVKSDVLRRRLFGIADEIALHDEAALQTMRQFFPEYLSRVSMSAQWVVPR